VGASDQHRLSSSYGRRLQGRVGTATGVADPLQWCGWCVSATTYRVLLLSGHHITSIPVTSIPCERLFSTAVTARLAPSFSSRQVVNTRMPLSRYFVPAGMCEHMHVRYRRGLCHDIAINKKSTIRALATSAIKYVQISL